MRAAPRLVLAFALVLLLGLGTTGLPAHADDSSAEQAGSSQTPAAQPQDAPAPDAATDPPAVPGDASAEAPASPTAPRTSAARPQQDEQQDEPQDDTENEDETTAVEVDDAQLRWSLNRLLHMQPHFGTNYLTAGPVSDTSTIEMTESTWKQSVGNVSIERATGTTYVPARFSEFGKGIDQQVVLDRGEGLIDFAARDARIEWAGSFGVVRYSGMTAFTVNDPVLVVDDGVGRLEATLSGYGVAREGNGSNGGNGRLTPRSVTLAELGTVDLTSEGGFSVTPSFYGVKGVHPDQRADRQDRWGSFPPSFIDFIDQVGQAPFWMTSGSDDDHKVPSPVVVSYDAEAPVPVTPPPPTTGSEKPPVDNTVNQAPPRLQQPGPAAGSGFAPLTVPVATAPGAGPAPMSFIQPVSQSLGGALVPLVSPDGSSRLGWWIAVTFLLMSAVALAAPALLVRPSRA